MFNISRTHFYIALVIFLFHALSSLSKRGGTRRNKNKDNFKYMVRKCMPLDSTLRAYHKSCFLRPDTGPCRADIIQWYYDVRQRDCYRFFWGGCQGNGNRFETHRECIDYCSLNTSFPPVKIPHFCGLAFDYGNCFAEYQRWTYDKFTQTCRPRLYSGCGGNQNNFESREACTNTCLRTARSNASSLQAFNICIPYSVDKGN